MGNERERDPLIKTCENFMNFTYVNGKTLKHIIHGESTVYSILFPYNCYRRSKFSRHEDSLEQSSCSNNSNVSSNGQWQWSKLFSNLNKFNVFPKVYASDTDNLSGASTTEGIAIADQTNKNNNGDITGNLEQLTPSTIEALARAYIARETGMDRVRMVFQKDHKGESSPQILYMKSALVPIAFISFFINYIPAFKFAKSEFIREHNATAFKTPTEAVRKMSDQASLKAILIGGRFAVKVTTFCMSFLVISQVLDSYRNKTSVWHSTIAAGITGGLARFNMGPKGFVSGSVVGMALGAVYGIFSSSVLHMCGITEDAIHLQAVISRLEVDRSIAGDNIFKQRMKELMTEQAISMPTSSCKY